MSGARGTHGGPTEKRNPSLEIVAIAAKMLYSSPASLYVPELMATIETYPNQALQRRRQGSLIRGPQARSISLAPATHKIASSERNRSRVNWLHTQHAISWPVG
jgi:hypothetical protein